MKKFLIAIYILLVGTAAFSQEKVDSILIKWTVSGNLSINSNGISSIPAFSLGDPALIGALSVTRGKFSYDPVLAYDLNVRPWFIDNWFHYLIVKRERFRLRAGINFSMYFSDLALPEEKVLKGERYWAFELAGIYSLDPKTTVSLLCWNDRGQDPGTITGLYTSLSVERNDMAVGKSILFAAGIQLFNIAYDGNNDGLFVAPQVAASVKKIPLSLFFQFVQPIKTNILPNPGFNWNLGAAYSF